MGRRARRGPRGRDRCVLCFASTCGLAPESEHVAALPNTSSLSFPRRGLPPLPSCGSCARICA
eukprot:5888133-Pyramimonas_sp.AAC.1